MNISLGRRNGSIVTALWLACLSVGMADESDAALKPLYALAGKGHFAEYPNNPVLKPGGPGEFDAGALGTSTVVKTHGIYHMYYEAWARLDPHHKDSDYATLQIGLATSTDLLHWTLKNRDILNSHDSAAIKVADDLWRIYYGADGQYDMPDGDVRLAVFQGHLEDLEDLKATPK